MVWKNTRGKREGLYVEHCETEFAEGAKPVGVAVRALILLCIYSVLSFLVTLLKKNVTKNSQFTFYSNCMLWKDKIAPPQCVYAHKSE